MRSMKQACQNEMVVLISLFFHTYSVYYMYYVLAIIRMQ